MSLSVSNAKESLENLQHCVMAVSAWMTGSKLKLNPSKTEFLLIGTKNQREKFLNNFPYLILGQDTNPSASAENLGVVFDSSFDSSSKTHITNMYIGHASIISLTQDTITISEPSISHYNHSQPFRTQYPNHQTSHLSTHILTAYQYPRIKMPSLTYT